MPYVMIIYKIFNNLCCVWAGDQSGLTYGGHREMTNNSKMTKYSLSSTPQGNGVPGNDEIVFTVDALVWHVSHLASFSDFWQ